MPFRVSGKNIDIGEALRGRMSGRIADAVGKYFDGGYSGHVTVDKEAFGFRTECVVHLDSGIMLHTEAMAADAYASADQAAIRLEKRLRRYKRRLKGHQVDRGNGARGLDAKDAAQDPGAQDGHAREADARTYVIAAPAHETEEESAEFDAVIIAESTTALRRFSVRDAVLELDMTGTTVVVFRHAEHGRVNLVYRRADGHIGWIDPPATASGGH